jgi:DNA-binding LacI/PurR family transcriptional regulator
MTAQELHKQLATIGSVLTTVEERTRLALKVGVSFTTVNRYLNGGGNIKIPTAREIIRQFENQ